jgi:hypothetical protein
MSTERKHIWQGSEGITLSQSLKGEHVRRYLEYAASRLKGAESEDCPRLFSARVRDFSRGQGFIQMILFTDAKTYTLWLFPDSMGMYLRYVDMLEMMDGGSAHQFMCRESKIVPDALLLIEIKGPI